MTPETPEIPAPKRAAPAVPAAPVADRIWPDGAHRHVGASVIRSDPERYLRALDRYRSPMEQIVREQVVPRHRTRVHQAFWPRPDDRFRLAAGRHAAPEAAPASDHPPTMPAGFIPPYREPLADDEAQDEHFARFNEAHDEQPPQPGDDEWDRITAAVEPEGDQQ